MLQFSTTRKQDYENCKLKRSINSAPMYEFEQKLFTHEQFCWHITYTWLPLTDQQIDELELKHVIK
jgi:hypothetical protein